MSDIEPESVEPQPEDEDQLRTAPEVARRCLVLYAIIAAGHQEQRHELAGWLQAEGLWSAVSPDEAALLESPDVTKQQLVQATWRAEALLPLLWALGAVDSMPTLGAICDLEVLQAAMPPLFGPTAGFIAAAVLRDEAEIYDALEEAYQAHWTVVDARINDKPVPPELNGDVIYERHYALNWLTGYFGQEWDDITTDT